MYIYKKKSAPCQSKVVRQFQENLSILYFDFYFPLSPFPAKIFPLRGPNGEIQREKPLKFVKLSHLKNLEQKLTRISSVRLFFFLSVFYLLCSQLDSWIIGCGLVETSTIRVRQPLWPSDNMKSGEETM